MCVCKLRILQAHQRRRKALGAWTELGVKGGGVASTKLSVLGRRRRRLSVEALKRPSALACVCAPVGVRTETRRRRIRRHTTSKEPGPGSCEAEAGGSAGRLALFLACSAGAAAREESVRAPAEERKKKSVASLLALALSAFPPLRDQHRSPASGDNTANRCIFALHKTGS